MYIPSILFDAFCLRDCLSDFVSDPNDGCLSRLIVSVILPQHPMMGACLAWLSQWFCLITQWWVLVSPDCLQWFCLSTQWWVLVSPDCLSDFVSAPSDGCLSRLIVSVILSQHPMMGAFLTWLSQWFCLSTQWWVLVSPDCLSACHSTGKCCFAIGKNKTNISGCKFEFKWS